VLKDAASRSTVPEAAGYTRGQRRQERWTKFLKSFMRDQTNLITDVQKDILAICNARAWDGIPLKKKRFCVLAAEAYLKAKEHDAPTDDCSALFEILKKEYQKNVKDEEGNRDDKTGQSGKKRKATTTSDVAAQEDDFIQVSKKPKCKKSGGGGSIATAEVDENNTSKRKQKKANRHGAGEQPGRNNPLAKKTLEKKK